MQRSLIIFPLLLLLAAAGCQSLASSKPMPDAKAISADGQIVSVSAIKGPALIVFFALWDPGSCAFIEEFAKAAQGFGELPDLYLVSAENEPEKSLLSNINALYVSRGLKPVIVNSEYWADKMAIEILPSVIYVSEGRYAKISEGFIEAAKIKAMLAELRERK